MRNRFCFYFLQIVFLGLFLKGSLAVAQKPVAQSAADIHQQLQQLQVLGSVLYIAAHPDDENTRLLTWLAKEKKYRTGYLSLTRGDGGQNLIGDEQGVDLGLIRTNELLAARKIDGAEQFFTRAFDFGFTKTTEEALRTWDHEKILYDVVWVIRTFKPDIIITRFPPDARAGHGHHSASAVLAYEGFKAAADPQRFPDQLQRGASIWQAKRILWNTFNFGSANTIAKDQFKVDVGGYNAVLGKSYGEIAAESRSQHKSQGFGVPSSRGQQFEYFVPVEGPALENDLMEGVTTSWSRITDHATITRSISTIQQQFNMLLPQQILPLLLSLRNDIRILPLSHWRELKIKEVDQLIQHVAGLYMEASTKQEYAIRADSLTMQLSINNRNGVPVSIKKIHVQNLYEENLDVSLKANLNWEKSVKVFLPATYPISQPYWLEEKMEKGSFNVADINRIGQPINPAAIAIQVSLEFEGQTITVSCPVQYKYTDPVKGELFQPLVVVPEISLATDPGIMLFKKGVPEVKSLQVKLRANKDLRLDSCTITTRVGSHAITVKDTTHLFLKGTDKIFPVAISNQFISDAAINTANAYAHLRIGNDTVRSFLQTTSIRYDHIPAIHYFYADNARMLYMDVKTVGKKIGYIAGAGDKIPSALEQLGYEVKMLQVRDLTWSVLKDCDAVITGVRAYNIHDLLAEKYPILMQYIQEGGNLIVQYNTQNLLSTLKAKIGPYPFTISRDRVTDEYATVNFALPNHPTLNYPNKITSADFEHWIQERSIYNAVDLDAHYETPLSMGDPDEQQQFGSMIISKYGKGTFVYTGLVFFRELPAGVPGAYRLLANLIALNKKPS